MNNKILLLCVLLSACGAPTSEPRPAMKAEDTVFAPSVQALDKARALPNTLQQGQNQTQAAIEAAQAE